MPRPKSLEEVDLTPFKTIDTDKFKKAYKGTLDEKGRMSQAVGKEFAGCEYYVFIKKCDDTWLNGEENQ